MGPSKSLRILLKSILLKTNKWVSCSAKVLADLLESKSTPNYPKAYPYLKSTIFINLFEVKSFFSNYSYESLFFIVL